MFYQLKRLCKFLSQWVQHIFKGSPKASQKLIDERFAICDKCAWMNKKDSVCKICDCNINQERILLNKLAWKDQQCPLKKW